MRMMVAAALAATMLPAVAQDRKKARIVLPPDSVYHLPAKSLEGQDVSLKDFAGKVALIVNLASR